MPKGKKYGGRVKGTPNKPKPYMALLEGALEKYLGEPTADGVTLFMHDLTSVAPEDRLRAVEKYLNYCKPRLQAIQADIRAEVDTTLEDELTEMI